MWNIEGETLGLLGAKKQRRISAYECASLISALSITHSGK